MWRSALEIKHSGERAVERNRAEAEEVDADSGAELILQTVRIII